MNTEKHKQAQEEFEHQKRELKIAWEQMKNSPAFPLAVMTFISIIYLFFYAATR